MIIRDKVSLWLGNFKSYDDVKEYTHIAYTEDGDSIPSQFENEFNLGNYERDLIEKDWINIPNERIDELLVDFSYDKQLIEQFKDKSLKKYNTVILLYNYLYNKEIQHIHNDNYEIDFIGIAEYVDE